MHFDRLSSGLEIVSDTELAILELKVILACTVRRFEVNQQYEEWDRLHPRKGVKTVFGERMYPVLRRAAKPSDGMPCRVRIRAS